MPIPPPPPGFRLEGTETIPPPPAGFKMVPTGEVVDGDTLRLPDDRTARLWGVDAYERDQQGRTKAGVTIPLGQQATESFDALVTPESILADSGLPRSYGRPVVSVETDGKDAGASLLTDGLGVMRPQYLGDDPVRLGDYVAAERGARLNRRGGHATNAPDPKTWRERRGIPEDANEAMFGWEPTPFAGLPPDVEKELLTVWLDLKSQPTDYIAVAKKYGLQVDPKDAAEKYADRDRDQRADPTIPYDMRAPVPVINPDDGTLGAVLRGGGDTVLFGLLEESGAMADTLGGTRGRENIWNSDRRFGDILANNLAQNNSIIDYDELNHPWARLGGQVGGALVLPYGAGARTPAQLARIGSLEGGAYAFGSTDGTLGDRLANVPLGAAGGAAAGYTLGQVMRGGKAAIDAVRSRRASSSPKVPNESPAPPAAITDDIPPPPEGYTVQPMAGGEDMPRIRDVIDVSGNARPLLNDPTDPEMLAASLRVRPDDILPRPVNEVGDLSDAQAIDAGRFETPAQIDEGRMLESRAFPSQRNPDVELRTRGPLDLVSWVRRQGGVVDAGGDLKAMGLGNGPRDLDFAQNDVKMGPLIDNEAGNNLDDLAQAAWEDGYFPDNFERPTINEFLDALGETYSGTARRFHPDDLDEVDAFYQQRDLNNAIGRSEEEGAPLTFDRSEPAGADDFEIPPLTAYDDWPAESLARVDNIALDKLDSPQEISRALKVTSDAQGGADAARRGSLSYDEIGALASDLGMTADDLLARRKGQAFSAEEALQARRILAKSGNELVNLARKLKRSGDDPGAEALANFRQAWLRHAAIQEQVSGMTAEAGRALQQFRMAADSREVPAIVLKGFLNSSGGPGRIQDAAEQIIDMAENPDRLNQFTQKAVKPRWWDKPVELWYNYLLSGPQTHAVNILSNTMTALAQIPEHAVAAGIGAGRRVVSREATDRVLFSEVGSRATGLLAGTKEGLRQFARTFRTGEPSDQSSKVEDLAQKAFPGPVGEVIRIPTRLLAAEDELFKAIARRMELHGLAVRQASKEGLTGDAAKQRAADLVLDPTDDLLQKSMEYGRYLTFTRPLRRDQGALSALGALASEGTQRVPIMKLFLPFTRTPTNLMKFAIERSPFAPAMKEWRAMVRKGGAERDIAIARAMVGSGIGATMAQLAAQGVITGSPPADEGKMRMLRADGWQPYSFRIGDKYYSYLRLDPFATTIGTAADLATMYGGMTERQLEHGATLLTASILSNLASKTWLSGVSDLMEALADPERNSNWLLKRLVGSVTVPTGVAQVARTMDPTFRETESYGDYIKSRIPGLSDNLPAKRDIWGEPITSEGGLGPDIISPIWQSTRQNDPVNNALLESGISIGPARRTIQVNNKDVRLTPEQYERYQVEAGKRAKATLGEYVASQEWANLSPGERRKKVKTLITNDRRAVTDWLFRNGEKPEAGNSKSIPAPPAGYRVEGESAGVNMYRDLQRDIPGIRFSSGYRSEDYQADMRRRGYTPATNSAHLNGSAFDLLPPPGKSMSWLKREVQGLYPNARLLNEGDHLHAEFPGYYGAPPIGNAKGAGIVNPYANIPPPPPGFELEGR